MTRFWLSVSMDAALKAWCLRPGVSTSSISAQVAAHAVEHGVSVSGLRLALQRAGLIPASTARKPKAD